LSTEAARAEHQVVDVVGTGPTVGDDTRPLLVDLGLP
jgi:hypothetical protein